MRRRSHVLHAVRGAFLQVQLHQPRRQLVQLQQASYRREAHERVTVLQRLTCRLISRPIRRPDFI